MELLTDLSIGVDGRAVRPFQDFIAKELFQVNEADACRRRPAPESEDNPWQFKSIRLDDHIKQTEQETAGKNKKKGHLAELIRVKDYFTLIRLGTAVHFNPLPDGVVDSDDRYPRILWDRKRIQPPRLVGGDYGDDLLAAGEIDMNLYLYYALMNLIAHLTASRHEENAKILSHHISLTSVGRQLVNEAIISMAGQKFVSPHMRKDKIAAGRKALEENKDKDGGTDELDSLNYGDQVDLVGFSSHLVLVLHAYLGQDPFTDDTRRPSVITQVAESGRRPSGAAS